MRTHRFLQSLILFGQFLPLNLALAQSPTIISLTPNRNAINIAANSTVVVTFDMPMDSATINTNTMVVRGSFTVIAGSYRLVGATATFTPSNPFTPGEVVTVSLTTGITESGGVGTLANSEVYSFTIAVAGGRGTFAESINYATGPDPFSVSVADFDGDGDLDLATASKSSGKVSILLNNGSSIFNPAMNYTVGHYPVNLAVGNLDRDDDMDICVTTSDFGSPILNNYVRVLLNNGDGTFADNPEGYGYNPESSHTSVSLADLDGDGDLDLVWATGDSNSVSVMFNNGGGRFFSKNDYSTGIFPNSVISADLDGDGDIDLATVNKSSNDVSILLNSGSGTFASKIDYGVGTIPYSIFSADLDGDGDIDLATANASSNDVSVLINNGSSVFASKIDYNVGSSPISVFSADLDGDGDIDLATANQTNNDVSILLNSGSGTFAPNLDYFVGNDPRSIFSADLNGDGAMDLATANQSGDYVSVLLNTDFPPSIPSSLVIADSSDGTITLLWDKNAESDILHYRVYGDTTSAPTVLIDSTTGATDTTLIITGLVNGTTYYFRVTAVDSVLNESDYSAEVSARPNGPPVWALPDTLTFAEDDSLVLDLDTLLTDANDADSTLAITFTAGSDVSATVDSRTHVAILKAGADYYGTDSVSFTATDPWWYSATDTVVVQVISVNDPPVITSSATASATEDVYFTYVALATDAEDSTVTFTLDQLPCWLNWAADSAFGTPLGGAVDTSFRVIAFDGQLRDTLMVTVTITPVNDPPIITSLAAVVATEDVYFIYRATATDPEGDSLSWTFDWLPGWLQSNADSVFGTPLEGAIDTSFRAIVADSMLSDTIVVNLSVIAVNDPPIVTKAGGIAVLEGDTVAVTSDDLQVLDEDNSNAQLQFTFDAQPTDLTGEFRLSGAALADTAHFTQADIDRGRISFAHDGGETLLDSIGFWISDNAGATAHIAYFPITIIPVNDPPDPFALLVPADGDIAEIKNDSLLFVWESSADIEGDTLVYHFHIYGPGYDTTIAGLTDTALVLTGMTALALDSLYTWFVDVLDGTDTTACLVEYQFRMPSALALDPLALIPDAFALHQNYPNPFNPSTTLRFDLPEAADVYLVVYDLLGREVVRLVDRPMAAGYHRVIWNGCDRVGRYVPSGIYIVRVRSTDDTKAIKIILMK